MDEIIEHLRQSLADQVFSKGERKTLKAMLDGKNLRADQLNSLKAKIYALANEKVTDANYRFILEWIKDVNNALESGAMDLSDAFFSPGDACRDAIIHQISSARQHLRICVFTISDDRISQAILTSHKRGLDIQIITDNDKSFDMGSDVASFSDAGIAVKIDGTSNHMHHKFMVVDGHTLITGSYNWTQSAARYNHENILLTRGDKVVGSFLNEFKQLWEKMLWYK